jgi:hypothetical protein
MELQKTNSSKFSTLAFIVVSAIVFVIVAIRCATVPFNHDETATFFYYIQQGDFLPYISHVDANNHILNSGLGFICFKLFGDSPFALRLPNLLALLVLIIATFRISKQLTQTHSRLVLLAGFLLSFHWLSFYSVCRGYGLSMAFLVLSISYLIEYFNSKELKKLFLFYLFIQLAISAILILVMVAIVLTFAVVIFQLLQKEFVKKQNLIGLFFHLLLIAFWIKYSFFLQENNALYMGEGNNSYWHVTFISLIQLLTGTYNKYVPFFILFCFIALVVVALITNLKRKKNLFSPSLFYPLLLIGLIIMFYLMKILLGVNYPEDRAALFFYVFFVISLVFTLDLFVGKLASIKGYIIVAAALVHFTSSVNFRKHSLDSYGTIPERFYTYLLNQQKASPDRITIAGQRIMEFIYASKNYRHDAALNLADYYENMPMNCDYALAWKAQEQYYKPYYNEMDLEKDWGIALLKRKEKIKRNLIISTNTIKPIEGNGEYGNLYEVRDTSFKNLNPLLIEFNIGSIESKALVTAQIVLQIDTAESQALYYKRIPLNWLRYDWNNVKDEDLCMVTGPLPAKIHRLVCYIWNLDKKEIKIQMNWVKIYQLEGDGITITAPPFQ